MNASSGSVGPGAGRKLDRGEALRARLRVSSSNQRWIAACAGAAEPQPLAHVLVGHGLARGVTRSSSPADR